MATTSTSNYKNKGNVSSDSGIDTLTKSADEMALAAVARGRYARGQASSASVSSLKPSTRGSTSDLSSSGSASSTQIASDSTLAYDEDDDGAQVCALHLSIYLSLFIFLFSLSFSSL